MLMIYYDFDLLLIKYFEFLYNTNRQQKKDNEIRDNILVIQTDVKKVLQNKQKILQFNKELEQLILNDIL